MLVAALVRIIFNLVFTFWLSPGHRWTVQAPARTCAADPWCCVFDRGRPPARRSACSSGSTAAPVCSGNKSDWTGWRPTARVNRSFLPGLDPERRISIIHFSVLPLFYSSCGSVGVKGVWPTSSSSSSELRDNQLDQLRVRLTHICRYRGDTIAAKQTTYGPWSQNILQMFILIPERVLQFFLCVFFKWEMSGFLTCSVKYEALSKIYPSKYVSQCYSFSDWHVQHELFVIITW